MSEVKTLMLMKKKNLVRRAIAKMTRSIIVLAKRLVFTEILVLGDSHVDVFKHKIFNVSFPQYFFNVVAVYGATISGLENPNSKTQAMPIFRTKLKRSKVDIVIVMLGEVDTGFIIWYRTQKYETSLNFMVKQAIQNYQNLLDEISKKFKVICISTPLPTIQDGNNWGEVANARKEVKATQVQRTELTLMFNRKIQEYCARSNIAYLMLDNESLGSDGLVRKELLNPNPNNHHYNKEKYAVLIIDKLKVIIKQITAVDSNSTQ